MLNVVHTRLRWTSAKGIEEVAKDYARYPGRSGYTDIRYAYVDPAAYNVDLAIKHNATVPQIAREQGAELAVNASFASGGKPIGYVVKNGALVNDTVAAAKWAVFCMRENGAITVEQPFNRGNLGGIKLAFSSTPQIVKDGRIHITHTVEGTPADVTASRRPRTALGVTKDGRLIVVVVDGDSSYDAGLRIDELAAVMVWLGAVSAINLDGGGSSCMVHNGTAISAIKGRRKLGAALVFKRKEGANKPPSTSAVKIAIDAGHGANTPGKRTPDGSMREFHFNSVVARYVRDLLAEYADVQTLFVHDDTGTVDVPLGTRTQRANAFGATAYVSIHANAFGDGGWNDARGIETYVHPQASAVSKALAEKVQAALVKATGLRNRGVKTANFQVLRDTNMPAVLAECGFMTNREEATLLKTDAYRRKCAEAIVAGIVEQFGLTRKEAEPVEQQPSVLYRVQVGAFGVKDNAERLAAELRERGYSTIITKEER